MTLHLPFRSARLFAMGLLLFLPAVVTSAAEELQSTADDITKFPATVKRQVDFVKDVQPIFQVRCLSCHGPDEQEGGFRLDIGARALAGGDSGKAIEPGISGESSLVFLVAGTDEEQRMPPIDEGTPLTEAEVATVRAWIDQGANWPKSADLDQVPRHHWAFRPIADPQPPGVKHTASVQNGIDAFILRKLEQEGISLSPEATRATLIRRLHLDLIGLPPSGDDVQKWLNDPRDDWYEHLVADLLDSPHYGERWARHWLDVARYADSDGYEKDKPRPYAWRWRDWVINALNDNMPFDRFTIEQIAGDLLPSATLEQHVATGFHRNTLINREGGTDPEEDRVKRTVDRTNTLGKVWLGMTVECGQCHSHKYDPLSQKEYYQLYAFFNTLAEPDIGAPVAGQREEYQIEKAKFDSEHRPFEDAISQYRREKLGAALKEWELSNAATKPVWKILRPQSRKAKKGTTLESLGDGSILASGEHPGRQEIYTLVCNTDLRNITGLRIEALTDDRLPGGGPGRGPLGNFHLTRFDVSVEPTDGSAKSAKVELIDPQATFSESGAKVSAAINTSPTSGWSIAPRVGERHVATFKAKEPFGFAGGTRITIAIWQSSVLRHFHGLGRFRISITTTTAEEKQPLPLLGITDVVASTIATPAEQRSSMMQQDLRDYFQMVDPRLAELRKAADAHKENAPKDPHQTTKAQVIEEMKSPRKTHFLVRGDFLSPKDEVAAGTPGLFVSLKPRGEKADRLDLARWLVDPDHPLTARVTVNRLWVRYFGRGIVSTVEDFGTQGSQPSHPELLDWLAKWFQKNNWDLKALHTLIVTSATYRQSSHDRPELHERDPLNDWLSHQNRLRVEGEIVRDAALSASGLIKHKIGGPSVRPPQPAGVAGLGYAGSVKWETSDGDDRYRRGLYTFFQRTVPYPMLVTFDSPDSNLSCVRRERSNTPLQALTLWNDPVFLECAQVLGKRIVNETKPTGKGAEGDSGSLVDRRAQFAFNSCLNRAASRKDLVVVRELVETQTRLLKADTAAAKTIAGDDKLADDEAIELAVWITIGRTILNLDEFVTRG
ncbi:MAG: hypothetical protein CMJ81_16295 [Planctomycetaceae bacterium]|nr:hypothetical protein [Planctomycetaceae bacterium]